MQPVDETGQVQRAGEIIQRNLAADEVISSDLDCYVYRVGRVVVLIIVTRDFCSRCVLYIIVWLISSRPIALAVLAIGIVFLLFYRGVIVGFRHL
jgi:hypothetical protein